MATNLHQAFAGFRPTMEYIKGATGVAATTTPLSSPGTAIVNASRIITGIAAASIPVSMPGTAIPSPEADWIGRERHLSHRSMRRLKSILREPYQYASAVRIRPRYEYVAQSETTNTSLRGGGVRGRASSPARGRIIIKGGQ